MLSALCIVCTMAVVLIGISADVLGPEDTKLVTLYAGLGPRDSATPAAPEDTEAKPHGKPKLGRGGRR